MFQRGRQQVSDVVIGTIEAATTGQAENLNAVQKMASTLKTLIVLFFMLLVLSAIGFMVTEHKSFWDGIWWSVTTATSTGYGDIYPTTFLGRIVGIALMLTMILFIIPIITAKWAAQAIVDGNAFTDEEQELIKHRLNELHDHQRVLDEKLDSILEKLA